MARISRLTRIEQRKRRDRINAALTVLAIPVIIAFFFGMYEWFRWVDCNTARDNLERIAKCEAHPNCSVRSHELARIEAWTRLEIARCKD